MNFSNALALGTFACAAALSPVAALAQAAPAPAAPSAGKYSDTEVEQFTRSVMALQAIQEDATVPADQKQAKMAGAVQQSGLPPEKFNEIASASNTDQALMQRIQLAAGKRQGGAKQP